MLEDDAVESKIEKHKNLIKKLALQLENQDRIELSLFSQLQISPEKLTAFLDNKENFSDHDWEEIQKHRQTISGDLGRSLTNVRNTAQLKKTYTSLRIAQHWIPVR